MGIEVETGPAIAVVMTLSFALSFFMSGMEAGVFALSRLRIRQLMRAGKPRAKVLHAGLAPLVDLLSRLARRLFRWTGGRTFTGRLFGSREELRQVMQESAEAFTSEERAMINRVLDLQHLSVGQLTTPLEKAITV